jgi:hypothetical protein
MAENHDLKATRLHGNKTKNEFPIPENEYLATP